jgi:hypothetical protein
MNHHHRKVLHTLFAHPINANIDMKDLEHLLRDLGAEIESKSHGRIGITLGGHSVAIAHVNHSLPKDEVLQVRKLLETCGIDPAAYPV